MSKKTERVQKKERTNVNIIRYHKLLVQDEEKCDWNFHNSAHHSSRNMRFSIFLRATPSPAAVRKCKEPVKRNFNWTKDFKHCTVDVNMSRGSRPENPRSNRKTRNSEGRLWISTLSSWSEKFRHPVSESCTIFLPTSAFTALARSSVHLP